MAVERARVLLVLDTWDPAGGGRERYAAELSAALAARDIPVTVCRPSVEKIAGWRREHPACPALGLTPAPGLTHYQLHSGLLADAFEGERQSFGPGVRAALAPAAGRFNLRRQRQLAAERELCADPSVQLMAFTERDRRALEERYAVAPGRITLTRPGVDLSVFRPVATPPAGDRLKLLFVGHNFRLKGLHEAIGAIAAAERSGAAAELLVAGRGSTRQAERRARACGLPAGLLQFAGDVPQRDLPALFSRSDAVLHPAHYDPFPRALIESLACGCPVVTTRACGVSEVLRHGVDGFVVRDPDDEAGLVEAIMALASSARRQAMRTAAVESGRRFEAAAHLDATIGWLLPALTPSA